MSAETAHRKTSDDDKDPYAGFLTPLQQSLVYELTTRRDEVRRLERRAAFWEEQERQRRRDQEASGSSRQVQFDDGVLDEAWYDEQIAAKDKELRHKVEALALKNAIVASADAAHAINASMAAVPPAPPTTTTASSTAALPLHMYPVPRPQQPLRSIVARRDALALQFLQVDQELQTIKSRHRKTLGEITALRQETSFALSDVRAIRADTDAQREAAATASSTKDRSAHHDRIAELKVAVEGARGKRDMVKGVLRGLILESGLDWMGNDKLCKLMLALGDEGLDSSDDDDDDLLFGEPGALDAEDADDSGDETMHP